MDALVTNIQGYSIHDGPGIRTVVFLKGCGLNCRWCANPEGISPEIQIGFIKNLCTHCGKCVPACPAGALSLDEKKHRIDYSKCTSCGKCAEACLYKALVLYGREMSVDEVFDAVRRDKMFYDTSSGGVTVSGGEPLMYAPFVKALFGLCREAGINTCVETSGYVNTEHLLSVLSMTDYLLFDLKHMNSDIHMNYTGQRNDLILANARLAAESGADILFRVPLMPAVNDTPENIKETAAFIKSIMARPRVQLMPFHRLGDSKYQALDLPNRFHACRVMAREELLATKQAYIDEGVDCSISA